MYLNCEFKQENKICQKVKNRGESAERSANVPPARPQCPYPTYFILYHLPASLPPAQTKPLTPTGMRSIQVPMSQINLRYRRRLCKRRSFRCRRGSFKVGLGPTGFWIDCACGGRMIDNGFRMLCSMMWIAAVEQIQLTHQLENAR